MTHMDNNKRFDQLMELLIDQGFGGMASALELLLNESMKVERSQHLRAAEFQRSEDRLGYANGFKDKVIHTRQGRLNVKVPQVRDLAEGVDPFYPSALERGTRSERALKSAIAEMYVQGVSTRKVTEVMKKLCGLDISSSEVSRAAKQLDEELEKWRNRELSECKYMILDARYEKARHAGSVRSCAVLIAVGILPDGTRTILGTSVSLSEAEVHWRNFLASLQERGLHGVKCVVTDDHAGLKAALEARMPGTLRQRCQFHLQQNASAYVPKQSMKAEVASDIKNIFLAPDKDEAKIRLDGAVQKYLKTAPELSAWLESDLVEGLAVFQLPVGHRRLMRTTNMLERLNREIKRRTKVVSIFPNEKSLLRLVSAMLSERSEEWEMGRIYISM